MLIHLLQSRQEEENKFFGKEGKINIEVQIPVFQQICFIKFLWNLILLLLVITIIEYTILLNILLIITAWLLCNRF